MRLYPKNYPHDSQNYFNGSQRGENVLGRSLVIYGAFLIWSGVSALIPTLAFGYEPVWLAAIEIALGIVGIIFGVKPQPAA